MESEYRRIAVVGLGYVGLPVAVAFGRTRATIGFDIDPQRIEALQNGRDCTDEVGSEELKLSTVRFTEQPEDLKKADFYIVAVPTPVNDANQPDLSHLLGASQRVGQVLKRGDIVVYESTVYPGATEEECIPVLEKASKLKCGRDFNVGYSPERINPGDKDHTFTRIKKVVAAQNSETLDTVAAVYGSVVAAGVFKAQSIKAAEAAKVIENTQRDLNIALMNELAMVFDRMEIDTHAVLEAAGTKWNFLPFKPGLVGGHCIGVDPYYLTHKSQKLGLHPQVILAGRKINDGMGKFVADNTVKKMIHAGLQVRNSTVTILGMTFKEDCPDIRNSKVIDIIRELQSYGIDVQVYDPLADPEKTFREYGVELKGYDELKPASAVVAAVAHTAIRSMPPQRLRCLMNGNSVLIDVKGVFNSTDFTDDPMAYWRL